MFVTLSDITLKKDIEPLSSMLDVVNNITPISFTWKDPSRHGDKLHFSFNAIDIRDNLPDNFAGYHEDPEGYRWILKDELIAVLWQAIKDLDAKVEELKLKLDVNLCQCN